MIFSRIREVRRSVSGFPERADEDGCVTLRGRIRNTMLTGRATAASAILFYLCGSEST